MTAAVKTHVVDTALVPWPLPSDWVMEGNPEASGVVLSKTEDARIVRGIWRCTPGSFRWDFTYDETLYVLEGTATVLLDDEQEVSLGPGDMAFFGRGHTSTWTVHETVRKAFHADSPDPLPF